MDDLIRKIRKFNKKSESLGIYLNIFEVKHDYFLCHLETSTAQETICLYFNGVWQRLRFDDEEMRNRAYELSEALWKRLELV